MNRIVYVNGKFVPETHAVISVFDRGFLMADAVYEVTSVLRGKLIDFEGHCQRLDRSLRELGICNPYTEDRWREIHLEMIQRNSLGEGIVYLQVTRGNPGDRDFVFPPSDTPPTVVLFTQSKPDLADSPMAQTGWKVICIPDIRWGRRDIKTTQLLYPSMAKMLAKNAGADDAWFIQDGYVTEGTSNNAYIIKNGMIITRQLSHEILHGITRAAILRFANHAGLKVVERSFSVSEAQAAEEAFITSASAFVMPVVVIDGISIGRGSPGPLATELRRFYIHEMLK